MQYVWDDTGNRYLDGLAGIVTISVGHCHPMLSRRQRAQNETLQHSTTIYLHPNIGESPRNLLEAARRPQGLLLRPFRLEANDLALLMARLFTGNYDVIALPQRLSRRQCIGHVVTAHSSWKFNIPPQLRRSSCPRSVSVSRSLRLR